MSSLWNQFESVHHQGELFCCPFQVQSTSQPIAELLPPHEWRPCCVGRPSRVRQQQFFQQNNKNWRKLIPKWKSQYTSQLFTFPSNLVGNFILVFKFLTNDTTKFKVAWSYQNVKTTLLFSIDKVPLNSLLSHSVQRHLSIFKLRRVQM